MPETKRVAVSDLSLDLLNRRTLAQSDEDSAVNALVSTNPDYFWALVESIIDNGYLPVENILVLESQEAPSCLRVREGNRRVAALKIALGLVTLSSLAIPEKLAAKLTGLSDDWKQENSKVGCAVYPEAEAPVVDRIVALVHGYGEKAGRLQWSSVAKVRHERETRSKGHPELDLLEGYLKHGRNLTRDLGEKWSGDYPITVLEEATKRIASRYGAASPADLASKYPNIPHRDSLEGIMLAIGQNSLGFTEVRDLDKALPENYGMPPLAPPSSGGTNTSGPIGSSGPPTGATGPGPGQTGGSTGSAGGGTGLTTVPGVTSGPPAGSARKPKAAAQADPKAVRKSLRSLVPRGINRAKVVTLRDEALRLDLNKNPLAFCFLLRSMFEISAKCYCDDHATAGGLSVKNSKGAEKPLAQLLSEVKDHIVKTSSNPAMVKVLHGASTELSKQDGVLSVTSMNQLVHNPSFSVVASDICVVFGNIFPLLTAMSG